MTYGYRSRHWVSKRSYGYGLVTADSLDEAITKVQERKKLGSSSLLKRSVRAATLGGGEYSGEILTYIKELSTPRKVEEYRATIEWLWKDNYRYTQSRYHQHNPTLAEMDAAWLESKECAELQEETP